METVKPNSTEPTKSKKPIIALILSLALIVGAGSYFFGSGNGLQGKLEITQNTVTAQILEENVRLEWPAITNTEKYLISRSDQPGQSPGKNQIATSVTGNYLDTSAEKGKIYYYRITALSKNTKQQRTWISNEVAVTIPLPAPLSQTPPKLSFEDGSTDKTIQINENTDIKIQWTPIEGAYKYRVMEKNEIYGYGFTTEVIGTDYTRKFMKWDVEKGSNTYTYTVLALNKALKPTETQQTGPASNQIKIKIDLGVESSMDLPPIE